MSTTTDLIKRLDIKVEYLTARVEDVGRAIGAAPDRYADRFIRWAAARMIGSKFSWAFILAWLLSYALVASVWKAIG